MAQYVEVQGTCATLAPINRLPTELLVDVIILAAHEPSTGSNENKTAMVFSSNKTLRVLSMVCARWRETVVGYPRFWATIHLNSAPEWVELQALRSGPIPVSAFRDVAGLSDRSISNFSKIAHAAKEVWLKLRIFRDNDFLALLNKSTTPVLESLTLDANNDRPFLKHASFNQYLPSLRKLSLTNIMLPWGDPDILIGLTELELNFSELNESCPPKPPTIYQLLRMVGKMTYLQSLKLRGVFPASFNRATKNIHKIGRQDMDNLIYVELDEPDDVSSSLCFFDHLIVPDHAHLVLHYSGPKTPGLLEKTLKRITASNTCYAGGAIIVKVGQDRSSLEDEISVILESKGKPWRTLFIRTYQYASIPLVQNIGFILKTFTRFESLEIHVDYVKEPRGVGLMIDWTTAIKPLSRITHLHFVVTRGNQCILMHDLLSALMFKGSGAEENNARPAATIILPHLEKLVLDGFTTYNGSKSKTISEILQPVLRTRRLKGAEIQHLVVLGSGEWGDMEAVAGIVDCLEYKDTRT